MKVGNLVPKSFRLKTWVLLIASNENVFKKFFEKIQSRIAEMFVCSSLLSSKKDLTNGNLKNIFWSVAILGNI